MRDRAGGEVGCCSWEGIGCIGAYAFEVLGEESVWDVQIPVIFSPVPSNLRTASFDRHRLRHNWSVSTLP